MADSTTDSKKSPLAAELGDDEMVVADPEEPLEEGTVAQAEAKAVAISTEDQAMGSLGKRFNRKSPFFIGMMATAGVAVTYGVIRMFLFAGDMFILIGIGLFLAIGMEPAVAWLVKRGWPRWAGVLTVLFLILGVLGGVIAAAIPALVTQGQQLVQNMPSYLARAKDHSSFIGKLNDRFHITTQLQSMVSSSGSIGVSGIVGAGKAVFSALTDVLIVLVLTAYFLADFPRIRALFYRLVPHTRRPRAILIGDEILAKVGAYVLGNLIISAIAGGLTFAWLMIFSVPYAALLSIMVAILDLVPVVGSTVAGVVVAAVTLTMSLPLCLATIAYFIVYRLAEDYLLTPRIIGKAVDIPALVTIVAVLIGGALLGIIGALVAIPAAAALLLIAREVLFPRLDQA